MNSVDRILARLEQLDSKIGFIQADVAALRGDLENDRSEYRNEILALRGDLAEFANRFSVATADNKKKVNGPVTPSRNSSPKSSALRTSLLDSVTP